jgi:predicted TIM-barrel fold metal-dependent hydrolase
MTASSDRPLSAPHDPDPRPPQFPIPKGACDCHAHVFGPGNHYPFIPQGLYTPADALPGEHLHMLDVLGLARGVLVQPSIYGSDNQAMLDAMAGKSDRLRGVAVVPFDVAPQEIERLHAAGVRGVRCNIVDLKTGKGELPLDGLRTLAARIKPFGWHLEFLMHVNEFPNLDRQFADFPVALVFGHLGYVPTSESTKTAGFEAMLRLARDGRAWVKLTAPYRLTLSHMPYEDVTPTAHILAERIPDRLLWGSDWPHVFIKTPMPNDGALLDLLGSWVPDEKARHRILVDNPAALYDFPSARS